jgi:hypothetical protein
MDGGKDMRRRRDLGHVRERGAGVRVQGVLNVRFFRQIGAIGFFVTVGYLAFVALATLPFTDRNRPLDTGQAPATIFDTEPKAVVYGIETLARPGPKVVLLGASNVREGLRPPELSSALGGVEVDNLAVGATNIREISEVVDLVYRVTPADSRRDLTFVLGVWYGTFVDDARRWPDHLTSVDVEMLRYGLYTRHGDDEPRPIVDGALFPLVMTGIRPVLLLSHVRNAVIAPVVDRARGRVAGLMVGGGAARVVPADRNVRTPDDGEKGDALRFWVGYMGPVDKWSAAGFEELVGLANRISKAGSSLLVLDLPIPNWHARASVYFGEYQKRKRPFLAQLAGIDRVSYANLQDGFSDDQFYDSAHPRPKVTGLWANRTAAVLGPVLSMPR